jgi:hypothetical protein
MKDESPYSLLAQPQNAKKKCHHRPFSVILNHYYRQHQLQQSTSSLETENS